MCLFAGLLIAVCQCVRQSAAIALASSRSNVSPENVSGDDIAAHYEDGPRVAVRPELPIRVPG
jgi:hypothetical protein